MLAGMATRGRVFSGGNLLQISMPIGGLGAGCIGFNGIGGLQDFSIRNHPERSAVADGHGFSQSAFALLRVGGDRPVTKLVEGPFPPEKIYQQGLKSQGFREGGHEGLPRFRSCRFHGGYPFGRVELEDPLIPLDVTIEAFNPFIPGDAIASGIPCAILDYRFVNRTSEPIPLEFSYHLSHPVFPDGVGAREAAPNRVIGDRGVLFSSAGDASSERFGSATLSVIGQTASIKAVWYRGGWFDGISALWREVSGGCFEPNDGFYQTGATDRAGGSGSEGITGRLGGSVLVRAVLKPGESLTVPVAICWHFPNVSLVEPPPKGGGGSCCCDRPAAWHPYYTSIWNDAREVEAYVWEHYADLRTRTEGFRNALFSSTLPTPVLDAVSANLGILKSPTVLRQANGNIWGWEGCFTDRGCCFGSCDHVWNYAQSMPHLFPDLERTLRHQELERSMDERGHVDFRSALPDGPTAHTFRTAADGQLGGILKVYREWQISGDKAWLTEFYPLVKRSLDYCIEIWDPEFKGVLSEPHHNTYDIEFWGPDGMCNTLYWAALVAQEEMAGFLGLDDEVKVYRELARLCAVNLRIALFNGEYFIQRIEWENLRDPSFRNAIEQEGGAETPEANLLRAEGPKYQYGNGCLSDGVIGLWMAELYGLDVAPLRPEMQSHLKAVHRHNFRADLSQHACTQRPGYAMGNEGGLLVCSWPKGGKPTLPFPYSDEVFTGIEYQVASHLVLEGMVDQGLEIVAAVRDRYDGRARNPWDEYECGGYYARAMASYALLQAFSGFRYSAVTQTLRFDPKGDTRPFRCFFATATGFGVASLTRKSFTITLTEGHLNIDQLRLGPQGCERVLTWGVTVKAGRARRLSLT
jgi:uncharacterized protein (DUF608 family)